MSTEKIKYKSLWFCFGGHGNYHVKSTLIPKVNEVKRYDGTTCQNDIFMLNILMTMYLNVLFYRDIIIKLESSIKEMK